MKASENCVEPPLIYGTELELWDNVSNIVNNFVHPLSDGDVKEYLDSYGTSPHGGYDKAKKDYGGAEEDEMSDRSLLWKILEDHMNVKEGFAFSLQFESLDTYDGF